MKSFIDTIKESFTQAIRLAYPTLAENAEITISTQPQFGDYQCNSAMKLGKLLGKNPRAVAEELLPFITLRMIQKLEIAGPGFINIWIDPCFTARHISAMLKDERLCIPLPQDPQRVVVEFSSPNVAKEMHVGHLRSTIIGDVIARLLEFQGHDVLRLNHIGDWGTAFGMLIAYIKQEGKQAADLATLVTWYKASKQRFDEDEAFKKTSQLEVVKLQRGDADSLEAWHAICEISRRAYQEIYDLLDIKLTERGESFYNSELPGLIKDLESKGLIEISGGAKCVFIDGFKNRDGDPLPYMVQKADGGYNYDTTDLAAMRHRIDVEHAKRIIVVTDAGQVTHFQMLEKVAEKAGYLDPAIVTMNHVPFGLVLGPDGKKFKTRSGETERLIDLINTAIAKAEEILQTRENKLTPLEMKEIAHVLGINAIKYADLACQRTQDYHFSYERMLRFEGNTAAFLMYAYVRICGIKKKIASSPTGPITLLHPSEIALGKHLLHFHATLDHVAEELCPHRLAEYLYQLAEKFHAFFRDCQVVGSEEQTSRLQLCKAVGRVLKLGMHILGLKSVECM